MSTLLRVGYPSRDREGAESMPLADARGSESAAAHFLKSALMRSAQLCDRMGGPLRARRVRIWLISQPVSEANVCARASCCWESCFRYSCPAGQATAPVQGWRIM